ncbi:MAG: hypothetical protein K6E27_11715 [Eubacterium sp.]|nr:hypothetical protein [Eubacterium sp.]
MFNLKMTRDDVEKLLDLQVRAGRITPELKQERLLEYDRKVAEMKGEPYVGPDSQYGQQGYGMPDQQYGQGGYGIPNQPQYNQPEFTGGYAPNEQAMNNQQAAYNQQNVYNQQNIINGQAVNFQSNPGMNSGKYPRVGQPQGLLTGPEMIGTVIAAIGIVVAAKMDLGWLLGILAGFIFAYIGIRVFLKEREVGRGHSLVGIIAPLCGFAMLAWGLFSLIGGEAAEEFFESHNDVILLSTFFVVGFGLTIGGFVSNNKAKNKYTVPVQATCIELISSPTDHSVPIKLTPVYEYFYNGETHRVSNGTYSNKGNPRAGEVREIFINPEDLYGYYDPIRSGKLAIGSCILGLFFVGMAVLVFFLLRQG